MSKPKGDQSASKTKHEPQMPDLIYKSFIYMPSVGFRAAPEILILELFREVFFEQHGGSKSIQLDPSNETVAVYKKEEKAILQALRGRRKKRGNINSYFAPAYPSLADRAWLREKSDRVINSFFLGGAITQYLQGTQTSIKNKDAFITLFVEALIGHNSFTEESGEHKTDILSAVLKNTVSQEKLDVAQKNLCEKTQSDNLIGVSQDVLSKRIFKDLEALCELEKIAPRMQWLHLFMTFLGFAIPMWILAHMRITEIIHECIVNAIDKGVVNAVDEVCRAICERNQHLLTLSIIPKREIYQNIENYMKKRIEINILIVKLLSQRKEKLNGKKLEMSTEGGKVINISQLLQLFADDREKIKNLLGGTEKEEIINIITREAERYNAWKTPLKKGQGKNLDEFFRILYRGEKGDETGGHLLVSEGRAESRGFRVYPGQLLLKTIVFLAAQDKKQNGGVIKGGGELILEDVESHFEEYGIDLGSAADARPLLMQDLQAMGLLTGSPDAGGSVAVQSPY